MTSHSQPVGHESFAGSLVATLHIDSLGRSAPAVEVREIVSPLGNWHEFRVVILSPTDPRYRHVVAALPSKAQAVAYAESMVAYLVDPAAPHPDLPPD